MQENSCIRETADVLLTWHARPGSGLRAGHPREVPFHLAISYLPLLFLEIRDVVLHRLSNSMTEIVAKGVQLRLEMAYLLFQQLKLPFNPSSVLPRRGADGRPEAAAGIALVQDSRNVSAGKGG